MCLFLKGEPPLKMAAIFYVNKSEYQSLAISSSKKCLSSVKNDQNAVQEFVGFKKVGINTL